MICIYIYLYVYSHIHDISIHKVIFRVSSWHSKASWSGDIHHPAQDKMKIYENHWATPLFRGHLSAFFGCSPWVSSPIFLFPLPPPSRKKTRKLKSFVMEWITWLQFPVKSLAGARSMHTHTHTPKTNGWNWRWIWMIWRVFGVWSVLDVLGPGHHEVENDEWFWSKIFKYLCNKRQTQISKFFFGHCEFKGVTVWDSCSTLIEIVTTIHPAMIDGLMMLDGLPGATIPDMDCPVP